MSLLKKNVIANIGGTAITALVGIFLIPLYLRYLGKEGFGLVAFFLSLQGMAAVLDLGLSTTATREMGRLSAGSRESTEGKDLLRTMEFLYFGTGATLFAILAAFSGWIAHEWIKADELEPWVITECVIIAAATMGLRWPSALFYGVLKGLERQVQMNLLYSFFSATRAICTLLILIFVARTVTSFYIFQLIFGLFEIVVLRHYAWKALGSLTAESGRFRWALIKGFWRYAFSMSWVSIFAIGLKQIDKILVSKLLPIQMLGYYSTASLAGMGLNKIGSPIQAAIFPRFSKLFALGDKSGLMNVFHSSAQLLSFLNTAGACGLFFFSREVLFTWTRSAELADAAWPALSLIAAAMMLNGMMSAPFMMILATGFTRISLYMNGIGLAVLAPATYFLTKKYGIAGAAGAWLIFNVAYFSFVPRALARKLPELSLWRFYVEDVLPFMGLGIATFGVGRWLSAGHGNYIGLGAGIVSGLVYLALGLSISPNLRHMALTAPGVAPIMERLRRRTGVTAF